ncbi:MAG TPA: hypothetical protein VF669_09190 [Tepidisphaeraceae bacterium]
MREDDGVAGRRSTAEHYCHSHRRSGVQRRRLLWFNVRSGKWKLKLETTLKEEPAFTKGADPEAKVPPALYNLDLDPGEQKNVLLDHPDVTKRLRELADKATEDLGDRRRGVTGSGVRPVGMLDFDPREKAPIKVPVIAEPPRGTAY